MSGRKYRIGLWFKFRRGFAAVAAELREHPENNVILTSLYCLGLSSVSSLLDIVLKVNAKSEPEVHFQQDLCLHATSVFHYFVVNRTTVYSLPSLLCLKDLWRFSSLGLSPLEQFPALQNIWEVARWCSMQPLFISESFEGGKPSSNWQTQRVSWTLQYSLKKFHLWP